MRLREGAHYVYALSHRGHILYIGKGSGYRLSGQRHTFGLHGRIISYFRRDKAAYAEECRLIAKWRPPLNQNGGGGGNQSVLKSRAPRRTKEEVLMEKIGSRAYCARVLLRKAIYFRSEVRQKLLEVAYLPKEFLPAWDAGMISSEPLLDIFRQASHAG